jgi:hypothetical protein
MKGLLVLHTSTTSFDRGRYLFRDKHTHTHTHARTLKGDIRVLVTFSSSFIFRSLSSSFAFVISHPPTTSMSDDLEDRKPTLRFDYGGFSTGEQNKVEDTTSSVKQRKLYNCVRLPFHRESS